MLLKSYFNRRGDQVFMFLKEKVLRFPYRDRGEFVKDSRVTIIARDKNTAERKYKEYMEIGYKLGFYNEI